LFQNADVPAGIAQILGSLAGHQKKRPSGKRSFYSACSICGWMVDAYQTTLLKVVLPL
jgi:hypothetical protein